MNHQPSTPKAFASKAINPVGGTGVPPVYQFGNGVSHSVTQASRLCYPPAILRAKAAYVAHGLDFEAELGHYLTHGYVVSTPDNFGMAKTFELEDGREAWFICCTVGELGAVARMLPFYRPWVAFFRHWKRDRLRVYPMDEMLARTVCRPGVHTRRACDIATVLTPPGRETRPTP